MSRWRRFWHASSVWWASRVEFHEPGEVGTTPGESTGTLPCVSLYIGRVEAVHETVALAFTDIGDPSRAVAVADFTEVGFLDLGFASSGRFPRAGQGAPGKQSVTASPRPTQSAALMDR